MEVCGNHSLVITRADRVDSGKYEFTATNILGSETCSSQLQVQGKKNLYCCLLMQDFKYFNFLHVNDCSCLSKNILICGILVRIAAILQITKKQFSNFPALFRRAIRNIVTYENVVGWCGTAFLIHHSNQKLMNKITMLN